MEIPYSLSLLRTLSLLNRCHSVNDSDIEKCILIPQGKGVSANNAPCIISGYLPLTPNTSRLLPRPMNLSSFRNVPDPLFLLLLQLHPSSRIILFQSPNTRRPRNRNNLIQSAHLQTKRYIWSLRQQPRQR